MRMRRPLRRWLQVGRTIVFEGSLLRPPYFTGKFHIVSAKLSCAFAECWSVHEFEQRLRAMTEVVALTEHQIKPPPNDRHEIETCGARDRACCDPTIRTPGANCIRDVQSGWLYQIEVL